MPFVTREADGRVKVFFLDSPECRTNRTSRGVAVTMSENDFDEFVEQYQRVRGRSAPVADRRPHVSVN